jgi:uncharacterized protein YndB with AHSA1/START domain
MPTTLEESLTTIEFSRELVIDAPPEIVWDATLEEIGPASQMPDGTPFPFKLERRPGGRWYRDLGNDAGHLWGHVQVIKPPKLLEISGPMFMSFPGINHVQYRLTPEGDGPTRLKVVHRAMGQIPPDVKEHMGQGWDYGLQRIREIAEDLKRNRRPGPDRK